MPTISDEYKDHLRIRSVEKGHFFVSTSIEWLEDQPDQQASIIRNVVAPLTSQSSFCFTFGGAKVNWDESLKPLSARHGRSTGIQWHPDSAVRYSRYLSASAGKREALAWQISPSIEQLSLALSFCIDPFVIENSRSVIPPAARRIATTSPSLLMFLTTNNGLQWIGFMGGPAVLSEAVEAAIRSCTISDRYSDR